MLDYTLKNDIGNRQINEDSLVINEQNGRYCFVVCDGVGGNGLGDVASNLVAKILVEQSVKHKFNECISKAFMAAQDELLKQQIDNNAKNKMKTTAAMLLVEENIFYIGHIGDTRVYVFGENNIRYRTVDHSVPQILALAGEISEDEIRNHPDRNVLLKAMGTKWEKPMFDVSPVMPISEFKAALVCSDGFWEYVTENEMLDSLKYSTDSREWLNKMLLIAESAAVNQNRDNYSAIAILNDGYTG